MKKRGTEINPVELSDPGRGSVTVALRPGNPGWYIARMECVAPFGSWTFSDECIEEWDPPIWADWMDDCAAQAERGEPDARTQSLKGKPLSMLKFLEPEIRFELLTAGGGWARVRIGFTWNAGPPTSGYDFATHGPVWLDLCLPAEQLHNFAAGLRDQYKRLGGSL